MKTWLHRLPDVVENKNSTMNRNPTVEAEVTAERSMTTLEGGRKEKSVLEGRKIKIIVSYWNRETTVITR